MLNRRGRSSGGEEADAGPAGPRAEQLRGVGGGEGAVASYSMPSPSSSSRASPARDAAGGESHARGGEELPSQLATAVERAVIVRGLISSFETSGWVTRLWCCSR